MADEKIIGRIDDVLHEQRITWHELTKRLGVSAQVASSWRARGLPERNVYKVAKALDVPPDRLLRDPPPELSLAQASARTVPVISSVQAGNPVEVIDCYAPGNGNSFEPVDSVIAERLGPYAFALRVDGLSMAPEYQPGDLIIVDPDEPPRPGDVVVAKLDRDNSVTLKKYRDRGFAEDGSRIIELVPSNPDYPLITLCAATPGRIIGPVIEHRRYRRR